MTTGIGSTPSTTTANAAASSSTDPASSMIGLGSNLNTFLTLLTTQLQNQDPTSPLDTNQLTSQLVQFSQVEQAINANSNLQTLISLQRGDQTVSALPLVNQTVQYSDNKGALVNGQVEFGYNLPSAAASATITISDASGNVVYQGPAKTSAGENTFTWDGTNSSTGAQMPDGTYTFNVAATAPDQSAINAAITAFGKVNSVQVNSGVTDVVMSGVSEPLSSIIGINNLATDGSGTSG